MEYRILVVCQRFWPENQKLIDICEGFKERGMEVDVLCGQPSFLTETDQKKNKDPEVRNGIRIFRAYETDPENRGSLGIFANIVSFRISSVRKLKELEKIHYDKIFIYQVSPVTMCAAGIRLGNQKNIDVTMFAAELWPHFVMDELDVRNGLFKKFLDALSAYYYVRADKLIVNSENTKRYFEQELSIPEERVKYIPQTAEKIYENTVPDDDLMERFAGSFKVVYTGDIGRKQDFTVALRLCEKLIKNKVKNVRFIIVGTGTELDALKEEVAERKLGMYFYFEGQKSETEIPRYLNIADVLLDTRKPNEAEDFYVPSKLASYMAAGKPLLLSMGGDSRDIVKEAECGFASEPEDFDAFYENFLKLYKMTRPERNVLGVNAKFYQKEHFNRDKNLVLLMEEIHSTKKPLSGGKKTKEINNANETIKETQNEFNWIDEGFKE